MRLTNVRKAASSAVWVFLVSILLVGGLIVMLWEPWNSPTVEGTLKFYCAAGIRKPVEQVIADYKGAYPKIDVRVIPGGSGALLSKIDTGGGEGDLYLSADFHHMEEAKKKGLVAEYIPVARIHPVLVTNPETYAELEKAGKLPQDLKSLITRDELTFVRADDRGAAIGRKTKEVFDEATWEQVKNRKGETVIVDTVGLVANTIVNKTNSVGVVWNTTVKQFNAKSVKVKIIPVPELKDKPETIYVGVLAKSTQPTQALRFARYLSASDKGLKIFEQFGYDVISDADSWELEPTLTFYAGAMLKPGIEDTIKGFEQREGVRVNRSYNGCGILVSKMKAIHKEGEQTKDFPDAYFSCDVSYLDMVQDWFEASKIISKNDMVLLVAKGNPKGIKSLADLKRKDIKIGLAHYSNSALGALSHRLLKDLNYHAEMYPDYKGKDDDGNEIYESIPKHIVHFDSGHSIVNATATGSLDVSVVYRSNALSNPANKTRLDIIEIKLPETISHKRKALAIQPYAVSKQSKHKYLMRRLLDKILEDQTLNRMKGLGFEIVVDQKK